MSRAFWFVFGFVALACGLIGAILPLLPTTPFLLLATFAFARSSPRLHTWLIQHPRFGPPIHHWHTERAISRKAKVAAVVVMVAAFALSFALGAGWKVLVLQGLVLCCAAAFVLSRRSPVGSAGPYDEP